MRTRSTAAEKQRRVFVSLPIKSCMVRFSLTDLRHRSNLLSASILKHGAFWNSDGDWRHKARDRHKLKITLTISLSSQRGGT